MRETNNKERTAKYTIAALAKLLDFIFKKLAF